MTDTNREATGGGTPADRVRLANKRVRRALSLFRWLYGRTALFAAAMLVVILGLGAALLAGEALPLGAAGLATVAAMLAALEGRSRGDTSKGEGPVVGRTWIAVFAIVVVADDARRFAEGYVELQRARICGLVEVNHVRQLPPLPPGQSRHFTCSLSHARYAR